MSQDSEVTLAYGVAGPPSPAIQAGSVELKRKRGTCKQKVTTLVTKIRSHLGSSESDLDTVKAWLTKLDGNFVDFTDAHLECEAIASPEEKPKVDEYFLYMEAEYQKCKSQAEDWLKAMQKGAPIPPKSPQNIEELKGQVKSLSAELAEIKNLLYSLAAQKTREEKDTPPTQPVSSSSPVKKPGNRVSIGGISYIPQDSMEEQNRSWAAELSQSLKEIITDVKDRKKEDMYDGPKLKLAPFKGEPIDYWPFVKAFESQVETRTKDPHRRLTALIHYTSGEVQELVQTCTLYPPEEGYSRARELLSEHYGNQESAAQAWVAKLRTTTPIADVGDLRKFLFTLRRCRDTLVFQNPLTLSGIIDKLPPSIRERWQTRNLKIKKEGDKPTLDHVIDFIHEIYLEKSDPFYGGPLDVTSAKATAKTRARECHAVRNLSEEFDQVDSASEGEERCYASRVPTVPDCPVGDGKHLLFKCEKFRDMTVKDRVQLMFDKKLCMNCFGSQHFAAECRSKYSCKTCHQRHHTLLHYPDRKEEPEAEQVTASLTSSNVALPIVPAIVRDKSGKSMLIYALLDSGSTCTIATKDLAVRTGIQTERCSTRVRALGSRPTPVTEKIPRLIVANSETGAEYELDEVLVKDELNISLACRSRAVDVDRWPHLKGLVTPAVTGAKVELLIGQDNPIFMEHVKKRPGPTKKDPYGVLSILGWYVSGPIGRGPESTETCNHVSVLDDDLAAKVDQFWKIQGCYDLKSEPEMSVNDKKVKEMWDVETKLVDGRYEIPIPYKEEPPRFKNNRHVAARHLRVLEVRLLKDEIRESKYVAGVQKYIIEGIAEPVPLDELDLDDGYVFYLTHHDVTHPRKPDAVRVVFNCALKYLGFSLNDAVHVGPDFLNRLLGVLIRFRQDRKVFACDISGMFNHVKTVQKHRNSMRFLWWEDGKVGGRVVEYRMTSHLFGGVWSPSCCSYALRRTTEDFGDGYDPMVSATILKCFYMDDCLKSICSTDVGIRLIRDLKDMLAKVDLPLMKFITNDVEMLKSVPEEERACKLDDAKLELSELPQEVLLGCLWCPVRDVWMFLISLKEKPATRRGLLSKVSSVFDPMGLVYPVVLAAKLIFQDACRQGLGWDDPLPADMMARLEAWEKDLKRLEEISFPRCMLPAGLSSADADFWYDLHMFGDASSKAYGGAAYLKAEEPGGSVEVTLMTAKGRLCPIKPLTIPRLELCAAYLCVEMANALTDMLEVEVRRVYFWTDSMIVLYYVTADGRRYLTFVANRVGLPRSVEEGATVSNVTGRPVAGTTRVEEGT